MLRVGLTGGIGSGKSTAARRFAELGAVLVDSDPRTQWVEALLGSEPTPPKDTKRAKKHLRNSHLPPTTEPALPST